MYLVGIDVGTTNTKAVIFDAETGQVRAVGSCRTLTRHPTVEWSEFDADELWGTVVQSLRQAIAQCDQPERIRAISVASMGEAANYWGRGLPTWQLEVQISVVASCGACMGGRLLCLYRLHGRKSDLCDLPPAASRRGCR